MAKRNKPHQIGGAAVRSVWVATPDAWEFRELSKDYGKDGEIEVFENEESTGLIIPCQIKGQEIPSVVFDGTQVSQTISIGRLRYLVELESPSVLFVVDTTNTKVWWLTPQTSKEVHEKLGSATSDSQDVTIHVPTANEFGPAHITDFLKAVNVAAQWVATNCLCKRSVSAFPDAISVGQDLDAAIAALQNRADLARLQQAVEFATRGQLKEASDLLGLIFQSQQSEAPMKVAALFQQEGITSARALQDGLNNFDQCRIRLGFSRKVVRVCRGENLALRLYAHINRRLAHLALYSNEVFEQTLLRLTPDGLLKPFLMAEMAKREVFVVKMINRDIKVFLRLVRTALMHRQLTIMPQVSNRLLLAIQPLMLGLRAEKREAAIKRVEATCEPIVDLGSRIAEQLGDWESIELSCRLLFAQVSVEGEQSVDEGIRRAARLVGQLQDEQGKARIQKTLESIKSEFLQHLKLRHSSYDPIVHKQMIKSMASQAGVNLDDPIDEMAEIVNQGLKDYSPERVVKDCEFLFMMARDYGEVGRMFQLPTAGQKELWCTKHKYGRGGWDLDGLYAWFKKDHCDACPDKSPRSPDWRWTTDWQNEETKRLFDAGLVPKKSMLHEMADQQRQRYRAPRKKSNEKTEPPKSDPPSV